MFFFSIFGCGAHFKSKLHQNGWIDYGQPAYKFFSIKRTFLAI